MAFCNDCNRWYFEYDQGGSPHKCPPMWLVWCENYGEKREDVRPIRASDVEEAAENWAERSDRESADYSILGGRSVTVCVVPATDPEATPTRWFVEGESVPEYNACKVGEKT